MEDHLRGEANKLCSHDVYGIFPCQKQQPAASINQEHTGAIARIDAHAGAERMTPVPRQGYPYHKAIPPDSPSATPNVSCGCSAPSHPNRRDPRVLGEVLQ